MTEVRAVGVRTATGADVPFITGLARRLAEVSQLSWLPRQATDSFAAAGCHQAVAAISRPGHAVLIASGSAGDRLGFVHAHLDQSAFTGETVGYVSVLAVTDDATRAGVGRRLMQAAEDWARQQGCRLMTLEVFGGNAVARAVYGRLGYQEQTLKLARQL